MDVQIWIINKSIANDNQTLSKCGIKTTGTTVYLYLKSIDDPSVKLIKPKYDKEVQTDENITMFMSTIYNQAMAQEQMTQQIYGNCFIVFTYLNFVFVSNCKHPGFMRKNAKSKESQG